MNFVQIVKIVMLIFICSSALYAIFHVLIFQHYLLLSYNRRNILHDDGEHAETEQRFSLDKYVELLGEMFLPSVLCHAVVS